MVCVSEFFLLKASVMTIVVGEWKELWQLAEEKNKICQEKKQKDNV